jgi:hypothetical protein
MEAAGNTGRFVSIDIDTGDYEVGDDLVEIGLILQARRDYAALFTKRIGHLAVYIWGGGSITSFEPELRCLLF